MDHQLTDDHNKHVVPLVYYINAIYGVLLPIAVDIRFVCHTSLSFASIRVRLSINNGRPDGNARS